MSIKISIIIPMYNVEKYIENNIKNLDIDKPIINLNNIEEIVEKIIQYIEVK